MSNTSIERIRSTSLILNVVLFFTTGLFAYLYFSKACPPCYEAGQMVIKHDTIYPTNTLMPISIKVPEAFKTVSKNKFIKESGATSAGQVIISESVNKAERYAGNVASPVVLSIPPASDCDSVRLYSDTCYSENNYRAVINDTVEGKIVGRSIWFVNLKPDITTTITQVKLERWKFYIGGSFTVNQRNMDRWGVGPSALLTIPKVGGISYYFDAKNFAHTGTFYALIRLKKQ